MGVRMLRLLLLRYRRYLARYALQRCREMQAEAAYSEAIYAEQLRALEAAIAMVELDRRYGAAR